MYKVRTAEKIILEKYAKVYPIIGITGPRQSGKTTTARHLFAHLPYVSFENLDIASRAATDPHAFLADYKDGAVFDEVQNAPHILSYLQQMVDEDQAPGRFIFIGSQNFAFDTQMPQSFARRIGMVTLLPLSLEELDKKNLDWRMLALEGGYLGLYIQKSRQKSFLKTILPPSLISIFQRFKRLMILQHFEHS